MNRVCAGIDRLMTAERGKHPEPVRFFFERILANYDEAIRTASRFFLLILAAWFLTYAIYDRWVGQGTSFLGLELTEKMIVVSPFLIGLLSYGLLSAFAGAVVLWEAVCQGVSRMLPAASKYRLEDLLAPPTFSNVERMLEPRPEHRLLSFFSAAWFVLVAFVMFGGSLGALVQTACLLFDPRLGIPQDLAVLSTVLGAAAWIRGMVLFTSALGATGGFHLGHHRGSARNGVGEGIT